MQTWRLPPPKLSKAAVEYDKKYSASPVKQVPHKKLPIVEQQEYCPECTDSVMHEDIQNGQMVCYECGLTDRLMMSTNPDYRDMELQQSSIIAKSQHKPAAYIKNIVRKYNIDSSIEPELLRMYNAVIFHSNRTKPKDRKSLPS